MFRPRTLLLALCSPTLLCAQDLALIPFGSTWKYRDTGANLGTTWRQSVYDDSGWSSGPAELGYGDGDEATVVSYGPNASAKYITTYFRRTFTISDLNVWAGFLLRLKKDDGAIVYVNGTEVMRADLAQGTIASTSLAYSGISGSEEALRFEQLLPRSTFVSGTNVIAVEVHQDAGTSSDLSFDLELTGLDAVPSVFDAPMLQCAAPDGITVRWTTDVPTNGRVRYGASPGAWTGEVSSAALSTDHELRITGLSPSTTYYYAIGTSAGDLAGGDATHVFTTFPMAHSEAPMRIWAIGDAGTTYASQLAVRDAYSTFSSGHKADVWLMLGDNAYWQGRSFEYHESIFKVYQAMLRNTPLFPVPGNHDHYSGASPLTQTGPYYAAFAAPKNGESGGVPSGSEAYYSFDHGRVHFIALDSDGSSRSTTGPMYTWLQQDLAYADTHADWIIAYWHHPPYTKGTHNSDDPGNMTDMRATFLPLLEAHNVDLVLCGHSHVYERSYLIDGHYGTAATFDPAAMRLDATSGRADATGPYTKPGPPHAHAGAVYAVCGVSGKSGTGALDHPAMFLGTGTHFGSLVIDVAGNDMTLQFLNSTGTVVDHFTIRKSVSVGVKAILQGPFDPATGLMRDGLRAAGRVPLAQPFTGLFPFIGEGGTETTTPAVLSVTGNDAIVDWVFLELRDGNTPSTVVRTRAALLQRDGDVVDVDGVSPVEFHVPNGAYHVALRHRNHFGVMTANTLRLTQRPTTIDLRAPSFATFGTQARVDLNGTMALWSGNAVPDRDLKYTGPDNDRDPILQAIGSTVPTNTVSGYLTTDTNLDGTVKYTGEANDRDLILENIGGIVPTNTLREQLP